MNHDQQPSSVFKATSISASFILFILFSFLVITNIFASETIDNEIKVTFELEQVPLKEVIKLIQLQTGYLVEIEEEFEENLVSGDFVSIELASFLSRIFKGQSIFVIQSTEKKTFVVKTTENNNSASQNRHAEHNTVMNDSLNSTKKSASADQDIVEKIYELDNIFPEKIYELDNTSPEKRSSNNHHLIDPQTGKTWKEAEELMKR